MKRCRICDYKIGKKDETIYEHATSQAIEVFKNRWICGDCFNLIGER